MKSSLLWKNKLLRKQLFEDKHFRLGVFSHWHSLGRYNQTLGMSVLHLGQCEHSNRTQVSTHTFRKSKLVQVLCGMNAIWPRCSENCAFHTHSSLDVALPFKSAILPPLSVLDIWPKWLLQFWCKFSWFIVNNVTHPRGNSFLCLQNHMAFRSYIFGRSTLCLRETKPSQESANFSNSLGRSKWTIGVKTPLTSFCPVCQNSYPVMCCIKITSLNWKFRKVAAMLVVKKYQFF